MKQQEFKKYYKEIMDQNQNELSSIRKKYSPEVTEKRKQMNSLLYGSLGIIFIVCLFFCIEIIVKKNLHLSTFFIEHLWSIFAAILIILVLFFAFMIFISSVRNVDTSCYEEKRKILEPLFHTILSHSRYGKAYLKDRDFKKWELFNVRPIGMIKVSDVILIDDKMQTKIINFEYYYESINGFFEYRLSNGFIIKKKADVPNDFTLVIRKKDTKNMNIKDSSLKKILLHDSFFDHHYDIYTDNEETLHNCSQGFQLESWKKMIVDLNHNINFGYYNGEFVGFVKSRFRQFGELIVDEKACEKIYEHINDFNEIYLALNEID